MLSSSPATITHTGSARFPALTSSWAFPCKCPSNRMGTGFSILSANEPWFAQQTWPGFHTSGSSGNSQLQQSPQPKYYSVFSSVEEVCRKNGKEHFVNMCVHLMMWFYKPIVSLVPLSSQDSVGQWSPDTLKAASLNSKHPRVTKLLSFPLKSPSLCTRPSIKTSKPGITTLARRCDLCSMTAPPMIAKWGRPRSLHQQLWNVCTN